ncbi:hypothetical protein [Flavobacterium geliluteum]|uniref:Uncharacterized protein n=1 Tax=Flavobacterium geliluteum TaxID=2816120 RepID=A0A940XI65_9FLAO|nr:hypothetical protein [Flavobacterium geliluteum]MBP4139643.1 hypothetical protein [Flavobacterium geliluteum]
MILGFSTQLNGKPTHFVEKITIGLYRHGLITLDKASELLNMPMSAIDKSEVKVKIHTIREDKNDRWKAGMNIDFFINVRKKNMFRFAPVLPVVSTQEVFMTKRGNEIEITVSKVGSYVGDDDFYLYHNAKVELALNDGFDSLEEFNTYFAERINENYTQTGNSWFTGKIIHWTDKDIKYG